jgi:hypothetical protein
MIAMILIGLAAGAASALMFASIVSGALISLLLFYLTPLPLMVAALGWGPLSALIGGIAASLATGAMFGLPHCIAFAVAIALPGWWLGYLVLLGRPPTHDARDGAAADAPELEWYPLGRILLWIAAFATLTTFATLLTFGTDTTTITATMARGLVELFSGIGAKVDDRVIEALIAIIPICSVMGAFTVLTLNLWLAAKITATSGRLRRPWPDLRSAALPSMTLVALCVAVALCFTGGLTALLAKIITSALMMAYAFTGFAVLHTLTLALRSRVFWLGSTYAIVVLFVWPLLAVVALGVADAVFGLRVRFLRSQPPPLLTP